MLLKNDTWQIFRPECNPDFQSLHRFVHLNQEISVVLAYLNAVLGGTPCTLKPPALTLQVHGRLITLDAKKTAANALRDDQEADKIIRWLQTRNQHDPGAAKGTCALL